jgi:flagellin
MTMTIPLLSTLNATPASQSVQKTSTQLAAAIATIVGGATPADGTDVASLSTAAQLQSQTASLRQVSANLAQGASLAQVADGGAAAIQEILGQLKTLAQKAGSPTLSPENRQQLNVLFNQLTDQVDSIASQTSFNGQSILDGSISGSNALSLDSLLGTAGDGDGIAITDLSTSSLFDGQDIGIASADNALQAGNALDSASTQVASVRSNLGSFQQSLDFAAANVDSALANQESANSTLADNDFATASTQYASANIQQNATIAIAAQSNQLSPALLQLIA